MSSKAEHTKPKIKTEAPEGTRPNIKREELEDIKPNIKTEYMDTTAEDMNESKDQIYSELSKNVNAIAKPLASRKLCKGLYRITGKAAKHKTLRRGVKEVTKAIRKGEKGIVVLAGDVTPIDVYSHLPVFCEENDIPYCYVPRRQDLGEATQTKRPTCAVMIKCCDDFKSKYDQYHDQVRSIAVPF